MKSTTESIGKMRQSPFIWLGSGRAPKRGVAGKGRLLDEAARAGLPVPVGGILLDDFYRLCIAEGLAELVGESVVITDPLWFHEVFYGELRFPLLKKNVAVRSAKALSAQGCNKVSIARLNVDFADAHQQAAALREVWTAMNRSDDCHSQDVMVMEMVHTQTAGVALSTADNIDDLITIWKRPVGEAIDNFAVRRLRAFQRPTWVLPQYARRLQKLLRGVRRTFGRVNWTVEWADDGNICWLLQIQFIH